MIVFVSIVHVIVCLMLVIIILLQPGRGYGLTGSAFGDSAQSVFGTKTADVLTKATTVAAILFMITCIALSAITARKTRSLYSNFKNQAPITMNQLQRAIKEAEKKNGAAKSPVATAVAKAVDTANKTVPSAAPAATTAASPATVAATPPQQSVTPSASSAAAVSPATPTATPATPAKK